jgi:hypothetical protein
MKENNKLKQLTLEELYGLKKKIKAATIGLGIVMLIACFTIIYLSITGKNYALIGVAIASPISLLPIIVNLNQINAEIKLRESEQSK